MTFNFLGPGLTVNVEAKVKEQIILDSSGFPAFNPSYYGLPDRDKEKLLNDIQLLSDSLQEVYLPKLMFFQDLFSLDDSKFRELVKRELEFDRSSSQKFSIETLMAIIFEEELQKIALIEGQKENFTK